MALQEFGEGIKQTHLLALKTENKHPSPKRSRIQGLRSVRKRDQAGNAGNQDGDEEENIGSNKKIKIIL